MAAKKNHGTPEQDRRDFLYLATGTMGAVGAAAVAWPLINQMAPDASTRALASIEVDVSSIEPGQAITVKWRGKPVFIRNRTDKEVEEADDQTVEKVQRCHIDPHQNLALLGHGIINLLNHKS